MAEGRTKLLKTRLSRRLSELLDGPRGNITLKTISTVISQNEWKGVLFGGAIRDLLLQPQGFQSRDYDVVVSGASTSELREAFGAYLVRQTRFGGLRIELFRHFVDIWPVGETWGFKNFAIAQPSLDALPKTTFLNVEAVAAELAGPAGSHNIYSHGFFEAALSRQLEINFEPNPFPELCVIRSLVTAEAIDFRIGPKLRQYLCSRGTQMSQIDIERIQIEHYGKALLSYPAVQRWLEHIACV